MIPQELHYTTEHEWLRPEGGEGAADEQVVVVGVTDYAQEQLGDIVFVSLPQAGDTVTPGASVGELESTKSVSDVYAPIAGVVESRNDALEDTPELINSDPYGEGWLFRVRLEGTLQDAVGDAGLLDADAYADHVA